MANATTSSNTGLGYSDLPRLMTLMTGDEKHSFSATSTLDVLWVLYNRVLNIDPDNPEDPGRDRFLLSKGHGPMAYYAVLAAKGFIPVETLPTFAQYDSILGKHPDSMLIPGVEIGSGSLGHGLPIAAGMANGLKARGSGSRVFCMVGDAESNEGSGYEAIAMAGRLNLSNLTAIVIDNKSDATGWPGGIASRFAVEGWSTADVDGRDHGAIHEALVTPHSDRPHVVVALVEPKA
ncbi:MAG: thiamine pyrophosphate-dependent enzyme [Dehalococcoidia bacterium]|jgi:transketolase|nr:thiamine pyrophosphate-dependent enzyme [Dehalococcoidia bacterium]